VAAYLKRIGVADLPSDRDAALRHLQVRHLLTVPFENLSIHLDEPITLTVPALFDKIVGRWRGGFCYELNGLFAALLAQLDYQVAMVQGGVHGPRGLGPPFDHMALVVDDLWLVDVGFGRHCAYPLRLDDRLDQLDPCGRFSVSRPDGAKPADIVVSLDGAPKYRLEARPRILADYGPTCWYQQSWPTSHFRAGPACSRLTDTFGQLTLAGHTLISTEDGRRTEVVLDDDEALEAYRTWFGVELDRLPVPVEVA
jgi:N-hydroxyarylamine O-acetyltransferase